MTNFIFCWFCSAKNVIYLSQFIEFLYLLKFKPRDLEQDLIILTKKQKKYFKISCWSLLNFIIDLDYFVDYKLNFKFIRLKSYMVISQIKADLAVTGEPR